MIDYFDGTRYDFLSNFHPSPITVNLWGADVEVPTVEHAFQAAKMEDMLDCFQVAEAETPGEAKRLGRTLRMRDDWDAVKFRKMEVYLNLKFASGSRLARMLTGTGDQVLVEGNHWHDQIWGNCLCKSHQFEVGQNHLGRLLMKVRAELMIGAVR